MKHKWEVVAAAAVGALIGTVLYRQLLVPLVDWVRGAKSK